MVRLTGNERRRNQRHDVARRWQPHPRREGGAGAGSQCVNQVIEEELTKHIATFAADGDRSQVSGASRVVFDTICKCANAMATVYRPFSLQRVVSPSSIGHGRSGS